MLIIFQNAIDSESPVTRESLPIAEGCNQQIAGNQQISGRPQIAGYLRIIIKTKNIDD
jgi:hypothetical protein